jgi:hypothetical protein
MIDNFPFATTRFHCLSADLASFEAEVLVGTAQMFEFATTPATT